MTTPSPETPTITEDDLTPLEAMMLEVLIARWRLGENLWTFPKGTRNVAVRLEEKKLVEWKSGIAEGTIMVWLTDTAKQPPWVDLGYVPPNTKLSADRYSEGIEDGQRLLVGRLALFLHNFETGNGEIKKTSKKNKIGRRARREAAGIRMGLLYAVALAQSELDRNSEENNPALLDLLTEASNSPTAMKERKHKRR